MPELVILLKGVALATRTVSFTLGLLIIIVYVFAVFFTQLTTGNSAVGRRYFTTVLSSMHSLLMAGCFPDLMQMMIEIGNDSILYACLFGFFLLIVSVIVMNVLVGALVHVVSVVSSVEKEELDLKFVKHQVHDFFAAMNHGMNDLRISRDEFTQLLNNVDACRSLQKVGVDVVGLVDFVDFIFESSDEHDFCHFMHIVLGLRGTNTATVKDVVDMRKYTTQNLNEIKEMIHDCQQEVKKYQRGQKFGDLKAG